MGDIAMASQGGAGFATRGAADQARAAHRVVNPGMPSSVRQQQQARAKLDRSVANLGRTAAALAAALAAQQAGRDAARQAGTDVPDCMVADGQWSCQAGGALTAQRGTVHASQTT